MKRILLALILVVTIPLYVWGADVKISALPDGGASVATTSTLSGVVGGNTARFTAAQLLALKTSVSGNAGTATALAADPANCAAGQIALGITAAGVAECTATPSVTNITGALIGNADTSTTAANVSGTPALPNGTTATTQAAATKNTTLATTAYADTPTTQTFTISDSGDANHGTGTLTPTANVTRVSVALTCSDAHGCTVTMAETGAVAGAMVTVTNISANHADFANQAGILTLATSPFDLLTGESLTLVYANSQWYEVNRAVTNIRGITIGGFTATRNLESDGSGNAIVSDTATTGTGAPVKGTAPQISTIELGHASDTTLGRTSAGIANIEASNIILGTLGSTTNVIPKANGTGTVTLAASGITEDGTNVSIGALNLVTTGNISGNVAVIDMGNTAATYAMGASDAYGKMFIQTHGDAATDVTLPDYQAAAAADHVKVGSTVCIMTLTAYATLIHPAADDKIRTSNGTLNAAGVGVTGPTTLGAFSCYMLTDSATDVGHWTQLGMNGAWAAH
jgi:hypothetical protein